MPDPVFKKFCPRCDREFKGSTNAEAMALVRNHLKKHDDDPGLFADSLNDD